MTMSVWPSPPPHPTLPSFQGSELTIRHGQTHQHRIRDGAPFWFHTSARMLIGEKKSEWLATTATRSKWRTISPFITNPKCDKTSYWKCIHDTFYVLCRAPITLWVPSSLERREKKKMVEVYLLYFLIIALWCKMCRKCLRFCHLKHWRVCICIVSLESFRLVILLIAIAYCVTNVSWHRTQILPFTRWPPLWIMYFSSQCTPFYLKRFVIGKDLKERLLLWQNFTVCKCSDGSYNVKLIPLDQFQSLIVDSDVILHSLLS